MLWFDIDFITFTTHRKKAECEAMLWFDIDFITFTTHFVLRASHHGCGLI